MLLPARERITSGESEKYFLRRPLRGGNTFQAEMRAVRIHRDAAAAAPRAANNNSVLVATLSREQARDALDPRPPGLATAHPPIRSFADDAFESADCDN